MAAIVPEVVGWRQWVSPVLAHGTGVRPAQLGLVENRLMLALGRLGLAI